MSSADAQHAEERRKEKVKNTQEDKSEAAVKREMKEMQTNKLK